MEDSGILKICRLINGVIFAVVLAYAISYIFFAQMLEQGFSMTPYINDRDVVLVNRLYKNILPIRRYDAIAFYIGDQESIKRVYGLPGETIVIENGNFYVDDIKLDMDNMKNSLSSNIEQNIRLGSDEYYVLGDNLDSSKDSRFDDVGNIKRSSIIGKVWYIFR